MIVTEKIKRMFIHGTHFTQTWKNLGFTDEDLRRLEQVLLEDPKSGNVIVGTGRLRKLRFNFPNQGKSGSVRVCYVDFEQFEVCYLLVVFAKNEQENLSISERHALKNLITELEKNLKERFT